MSITNPSFETVGGVLGSAFGWQVDSVQDGYDWHQFTKKEFETDTITTVALASTTTSLLGFESFHWWVLWNSWDLIAEDLTYVSDDFESGWLNDTYLTSFEGNQDLAIFESEPYEDFEEAWQNDSYVTDWASVSEDPAQFDSTPQNFEDFEEEWKSNGSYVTDWASVTEDVAQFDVGVAEDFEDFEEEWPSVIMVTI
jgi:hypothetical protein